MLARMVAALIVVGACGPSEFGKPTFNVESSAAVDGTTFTVTFDAAPDPTQAIDKRNYGVA